MQNRRKFLIQGSLAAGAAVLLKPLEGFSKAVSYMGLKSHETLTILHTSDLYMSDYANSTDAADIVVENILAISKKVNNIRSTSPNIVLLNNGNIFNVNKADASIYNRCIGLMGKAGYDGMVTGAKDIAIGFEEVAIEQSIPFIDSINSDAVFAGNKILPYHLVQKGNIKVGIIANGVMGNSSQISIVDKAKTLSNTAEYLKKDRGYNIVICLSTSNMAGSGKGPIENDKEMAALSTGIDIIITGNNPVDRPINFVSRNAKKEEVLIHSTTSVGSAVGRIDITFNEKLLKHNIKAYYK